LLAPHGAFLGLALAVFASVWLVLWEMRETLPTKRGA
jgi:hypothetical protein